MDFDETSSTTYNSSNNNPNQEGGNELDDLLFLDKDFKEQQFFPTKDCILFLIDCSPSMHNLIKDSDKTTTPLSSLLNVTENFLKSKIISNQNDLFGIILFNTSKTNNELNFEGVNVLFKIEAPNAFNIKKIKMMSQNCDPEINQEKYKQELNEIFPSIENNPNKLNFLNNAMWIAQSLLKTYEKKKLQKKNIFIY